MAKIGNNEIREQKGQEKWKRIRGLLVMQIM
jgi:hypothetical protein